MKFRVAHTLLYIVLLGATLSWVYLYQIDHQEKSAKSRLVVNPTEQSLKYLSLKNKQVQPHQLAEKLLSGSLKRRPAVERISEEEHPAKKGPNAAMMRGPDPNTKMFMAAPLGRQIKHRKSKLSNNVEDAKKMNNIHDQPQVAESSSMYDTELLNNIRFKVFGSSPKQSRPHKSEAQSENANKKVKNETRSEVLPPNGMLQLVDAELKGRLNGFFVEYGTNDSGDSLFLELSRNWTGLIVEPNPIKYKNLLNENRKSFILNACLTSRTPEPIELKVRPLNKMNIAPAPRKKREIETKETELDVDCYLLNSIMAALKLEKIDYLSLTADEFQPEVLETIDWTRLHVDVIAIKLHPVGGGAGDVERILKNIRSIMLKTTLYRPIEIPNSGQFLSHVAFKRFQK